MTRTILQRIIRYLSRNAACRRFSHLPGKWRCVAAARSTSRPPMPCSTPIRLLLIAVLIGCPLICHLDIATAEGEVEHCCDCAELPSDPADSSPDDSDDDCPCRNCLCGGAVLGSLCPKVFASLATLSPVFVTPVVDLFGATSAQTRVAWTTPRCVSPHVSSRQALVLIECFRL